MKKKHTFIVFLCLMLCFACSKREAKQENTFIEKKQNKVVENIVELGRQIFANNCATCHTVTQKDLIGPGMQGITKRREKKWIISFIRNSQALISSGDAEAIKVFKKYKSTMTSFLFEDKEMENLYHYLESLE